MKKQPFVLLEILIAISLILLCILPLIHRPLEMHRNEFSFFWEIEGERLADWSLSEIKEKLLKNEVPWKKLPASKKTTASFSLPDFDLSLPNGNSKTIHREFTLKFLKEKEGQNEEIYRLLEINIHFTPQLKKKDKPYQYQILVRFLKS